MEPTSIAVTARLLAELGQRLNAPELQEHRPGLWTIVLADGQRVDVEYDAGNARLRLATALGQPEPEQEDAVFKLMLQINALWRDTGGLRLVLEDASPAICQLYDIAISGLEIEGLALRISNFIDVADHWREVIAASAAPLPEPRYVPNPFLNRA